MKTKNDLLLAEVKRIASLVNHIKTELIASSDDTNPQAKSRRQVLVGDLDFLEKDIEGLYIDLKIALEDD